MDREIPSVPITTLAGVASLTDLLPEMPLPSPLPQTLSNKSLLFHPRVAEEAQNLLGTREHTLIPQLVQSLLQSSTDYIELKDHYANTEQNVDQQQSKPQLLQAILEKNPNVFNNHGPQLNATRAQPPHVWNHSSATSSENNYLLQSNSAAYGQLSPCGANRHTPQGSPASPASARFPLTTSHHSLRSTVVTDPQQQQQPQPPLPPPTTTTISYPSAESQLQPQHQHQHQHVDGSSLPLQPQPQHQQQQQQPQSQQQQQQQPQQAPCIANQLSNTSTAQSGGIATVHTAFVTTPHSSALQHTTVSSRISQLNCTNVKAPTSSIDSYSRVDIQQQNKTAQTVQTPQTAQTVLRPYSADDSNSYVSSVVSNVNASVNASASASANLNSNSNVSANVNVPTTSTSAISSGSMVSDPLQPSSVCSTNNISCSSASSTPHHYGGASSASFVNNLQDFEQALPVQRIQTVSALYANSEQSAAQNSRVPSNISSASSTDNTIIKVTQHSTSINQHTTSTHNTMANNIDKTKYFQQSNTGCFAQTGANINAASMQSTTSDVNSHVNSQYPYLIGGNADNRRIGCERQDHMAKPMNIRGPSPAQASDAPPAPSAPTCGGEQSFLSMPAKQNQLPSNPSMPQPIVRLNRITQEDQALMQKSLTEFAENRPELASKLGITSSNQASEESEDDTSSYESKLRSNKDRKRADESDSFSSLVGVRKRKASAMKEPDPPPVIEVSKPKLRKVERRFVPVLEKLSIEELMETNTYVRFSRSIDKALENVDESVLDKRDDVSLSDEPIISRYQLQELCSEAAKLKTLGAMHMIPAERLVRLLNLLEDSIRAGHGISPLTDPDDNEDIRQMWMETAMDRVMSAVDASLTCMYVMTSTNMSKRVYLEDTIDRVVLFVKYQLHNTIFPSFDVIYRVDTKKKVDNRRRSKPQGGQVREKSIVQLYNKTHELVSLLAELMQLQTLTDTTVLHASSMGVAPFFVDNVSELQLSCLKLVTTIFTKYENHRRLLLDDILSSIARLPSSKRGLRSYRLLSDTEEYIQMLAALVLQLIQCVVALPESLANEKDRPSGTTESNKMFVDKDVLIHNKYEIAKTTAGTFLTVFLGKCGNKSEEIDYRPLFENFVQDLLTTVNKPEWPASEMLLSLLGTMLVKNFTNKSLDVTLRVASLDYLGVIAARLRKDAVTSTCKLQTIDQMIKDIKNEEIKDGEDDTVPKPAKTKFRNDEEERTHFLQRVLLDYLAVNGQKDQAHRYARHFYLVQWYRDAISEKKGIAAGKANQTSQNQEKVNSKPKKTGSDDSGDDSEMDEPLNRLQANANSTDQLNELYRSIDERKKFYISKIRPFQDNLSAGNRVQVLQTYIDYKSAELIAQYLASKRSFSQSFDQFLKHILVVLRETSIAIRTKAMKCLTMIVEADPAVLGRTDMQIGVNHSFLDLSTSVREAAVDLVGKFVLSRPELIDKYYNMLLARILDTGVSVRKRVIKILKDICIECPQFHKIPEICVKMIRRVNDEEGIRKLVMEVFQNMWFTPTPEKQTFESDVLLRKVMNIIDVVASSKDIGIEWFEMLLISLFKPREDKEDSTKIVSEPPKSLLTACRQIVDCLIENVLRLEEGGQGGGGAERLVACLITLYLFAKIRPQLLVKHASTLQPYLSYKCQTKVDHQIVSYVAQTLELVVPLIVHPSETFLAQLEEDATKLILQSSRPVVASCIACLSSIVNNVTRNYKLIRDCFNKYYGWLCIYKTSVEKDISFLSHEKYKPAFRRSMFTVGLLLRHFDFTDTDVIRDLPVDIKDQVFNTLVFYLKLEDKNIQANTLMAIGYICVRHYDFMLLDSLKKFYHSMLMDQNAPLEMKTEVLRNIEMYLLEEENRMIKQDQEWAKRSKDENLKEMGDISSGMASTVIQLYLKEILQSFIHPNILVRHSAMRVIQLILQQGLVHPVQIVPYLICMSTDEEKMVSNSADRQLQDIEKKYPGFIHMKSQFGIRLSYQLQRIIQNDEIVRGFRVKEKGEYPSALNGYLYSILRNTKQQRRAIVLSILKQFDEQVRTTLSYMLYLADNLAYFPFQVQDEPLFIIHHIDIMISVSGTNLLQSFKEALLPINGIPPVAQVSQDPLALPNADGSKPDELLAKTTTQTTFLNTSTFLDDDDEEDEAEILSRLPEDTKPLQSCITAAQGCLLLLVLKQHLKDVYGISDSKILQYSPTETAKVYEKAVTRRSNSIFNPKATLNRLKQGSPPPVLDEEGRKDLVSQYLDFKQLMLKLDPDDDDDDENTSTNAQNRVGGGAIVNNTSTSGSTSLNNSTHQSTTISQTGNDQTKSVIVNDQNPKLTSNYTNVASSDVIGSSHGSTDSQQASNTTQILNSTKEKSPPRVPKLVISNRRPIATIDLTSDTRSRSSRSHRASEKPKKHRQKRKRKKLSTSSGEDSENDYSDPDFLV